MYAQLSSSYQWKQINQNDAIMNKLNTVMQEGMMITLTDIPSAVLKLKNRSKSPITSKIFEAIEEGDIVLIYAPTVKMPLYLPFIVSQSAPNSFKGYVFLNSLATSAYVEGKELELNDRQLKVVLEACFISLEIRKLGESPKLRSSALLRSGSKIYSGIVVECINRKHNIKLDVNIHNALIYLTSKFYIYNMLGCKNMDKESMDNYCLYNCSQLDIRAVSLIIEQFTEDDFENIGTFISKLSKVPELQKRLGSLTVSNFLESYINMYDSTMLFALETFPYFLYNIISVNESTYINNYQALKNIVGDDGRKIYADLIVTVG